MEIKQRLVMKQMYGKVGNSELEDVGEKANDCNH